MAIIGPGKHLSEPTNAFTPSSRIWLRLKTTNNTPRVYVSPYQQEAIRTFAKAGYSQGGSSGAAAIKERPESIETGHGW